MNIQKYNAVGANPGVFFAFLKFIREVDANHTHIKRKSPARRHSRKRVRHRLHTQTQRTLDGRLFATTRRRKERALQAVKLRRNHGRRHVRIYRSIPNHTGKHAQAGDD